MSVSPLVSVVDVPVPAQEIVEPEEEQERQWEPDHREPAAPSPPAQELALLLARGRSPSR